MKHAQPILTLFRFHTLSSVAFTLALALVTPLAFSQTPTSVPLGPFDLQASVSVEYVEDDNLFQDSTDQVSASITTISPSVELLFDNGVSGFSLSYTVQNATFSGDPGVEDEDYTDQRVDLTAGTLLGGLHRFEVAGSHFESHDRQSEDRVSGSATRQLDYFEDRDYRFIYTLGTDASLLNLELLVGQFERTYIDNRFDMGVPVTAEFDREESLVGAALVWNFRPNLNFGISYTDTEIEYVVRDSDGRNGDEQLVAFNLTWEPASAFNIDLSFGQTTRQTLVSGSNTSDYWSITAEWQPVSYSTLSLFTASYADEAQAVIAGYSEREEFGFGWAHDWTERLETELSYVDGSIAYVASSIPREDLSESVEFRVAYQFRRWVNIGAFVQQITRTTSTVDDDYDQNIYGVSAVFQL